MNGTWTTPDGHDVFMAYRDGTNDWNTISSVMTNDEYRMHDISGTAVDVGAHIGSATVAMLIDNPDLHVHAVEPIPDNLELLRFNLEQNGLTDRCTVIEGMVGTDTVEYGFTGTEAAVHHAYIGNATGLGGTATLTATARRVRLAEFWSVDFLKIDCEGGEWGFLDTPAVGNVALIVGEWHPVGGHTQGDMLALLGKTHVVTFDGPQTGPGGFRAERRR
jgi:FkbM family methyltransferase